MSAEQIHTGLLFVSQLFSYPQQALSLASIPAGVDPQASELIVEMNAIDSVRLQNEYVRLFINALPEVPCAPYGSIYLEGTIMGQSTVKVSDIYRKYSLVTQELADHIAVETEFLAWLYAVAAQDETARNDYFKLLDHLKQWAPAFFDCVAQHDRLGCFRQGARLAQSILKPMEGESQFRLSEWAP